MWKKDLLRLSGRIVLILAGSVFAGALLLVLAFCIPTGRIADHVRASLDRMIPSEKETEQAGALERYIRTERESFTDAIMVQNSLDVMEGTSVYERAMMIYHHDLDPDAWTPEPSMKAYLDPDNEEPFYIHQYARYWHGYLILLKPLLFLFTWGQTAVLNVIAQLLLLAAVVWAACRRGRPELAAAVAVPLLFMKPLLMLSSFAMSACFLITLAALLCMLLFHERLQEKKRYPEFFLVIGILTAYFDFLTYPVVTLGFPLTVYFLLKKREPPKRDFLEAIGLPVCWGIGYGGFWVSKWILTDLTLHSGTIRNAMSSLVGWTDVIGGRPRVNGTNYVVELILQQYDSAAYPVMLAVLLLLLLAALILAGRRMPVRRLAGRLLPFAVTALIPVVWLFVVQHHSGVHAHFTFRILGVAVMALCGMGLAVKDVLFNRK